MKTKPRPASRMHRRQIRRLQLLALLGITTSTSSISLAQNPTGGNVVAGAATINTVGNTLNVNASTDRAVVNWNSFSVGQGNTANFNLPSASSAILNRVNTPGMPSVIAGQLNSNGNVFLVNPSGVVVSNTGVINTNGFTASTFDTTNREFMNGGPMAFRGSSTAGIVNNGTINTGAGGAHFIGNQFNNNGSITSVGGAITVGSGQIVTYANGVTHVEADMATLQNGYSETAGLINNSGTMRATGAVMTGGDVYLTNPGGKVLNSGIITASRSTGSGATIGGNVAVTADNFNTVGSLDVSGSSGGSVSIAANDVLIQGQIDASGTNNGGRVEVVADNIDQFADVDASSSTGVGGDVRFYSNNAYTATSAGDIDVSGADGGSVSIAGPGRIVTSASIKSTGASGAGGSIDVSSDTKTSLLSANVDASGATDGGNIRIGGALRGGRDSVSNEIVNSDQTLISPGTSITAFGGSGQGGTAIVWSDERTQFYGSIDVAGSVGSGGFIEISSAGLLEYKGLGSLETGGGTVLLDPKNGVIVDQAPSGMSMITFSLTGSRETFPDAFDRFGDSVGLNAAGDRLAVGATGDDGGSVLKGGAGAVYLFDLDPSDAAAPVSLAQILRDGSALSGGQTLELEAGDRFGSAVDFDGPGGILAVGADRDDFIGFDQSTSVLGDTGAVYLFELDTADLARTPDLQIVIRDGTPLVGGSPFNLLANESMSSNPQLGGDRFGTGVAVNEDGNRLVVGANGIFGSFVYLFEINPTNLGAAPNLAQRLGSDTLPSLGDLGAAGFGESVSINSVGDILAVGAPELNNRFGGVYLFNLIAQNYGQPVRFRQLIENGAGGQVSLGQAEFGSGVAINGVGDILGVGAENLGFLSGGVFGFQLNPTDLTIAPNLLIEVSNGSTFGNTEIEIGTESYGADIAINAAGSRVAVGSPGFDGANRVAQDSGSVSIFDLESTATGFRFQGQRVGTNVLSAVMPSVRELGLAVELGSDRTQLAVSSLGPEFGDEFGQVHFFLLDESDLDTSPTLVTTLRNGSGIRTPVGLEILRLDDQDMFGSSLSIADQGRLLAIGAAGDDGVGNSDTNSGAIYLFNVDQTDSVTPFSLPQVLRNNQSLAGGGQLMLGDFSGFGNAIALTEDGSRLVAGATGDSKAFLFEFGSGFMGPATLAQTIQDGSTLADNSTLDIPFSPIGYGVSVNAAGDRLAVGERNGAGGGVYLFGLNPNDWSQAPALSQELRRGVTLADGGSLLLTAGGEFGRGVSFNDAGDRLAVGQSSDFNLNKVFLFGLDPNDLSVTADLQQTIATGTVLASGSTFQGGNATFGTSVSLDGAGDRLAVGNPERNRFHLFDFGGGGFEQAANLAQTISNDSPLSAQDGLPAGSGFGGAVALNGSGSRLAVEANRAVYLFDVDTSLANTPILGQVIRSGSGLSNGAILDIDLSDSDFGNDLAFNGVGDILAVGDPQDRGAVYLFGLDPDSLNPAPSLGQFLSDTTIGPAGLNLSFGDRFGFSVDLNEAGNRLAVGAIGDKGLDGLTGANTGAVYIFDINAGDLTETAQLRASIKDGSATRLGPLVAIDAADQFGFAVALTDEGNYVAIGIPGDDGIGNLSADSGNVVIYRIPTVGAASDTSIDQVINMVEMQGVVGTEFVLDAGDRFGSSVSFAGPGNFIGDVGTDVFGQINGHAIAAGAPGDDGANNGLSDTGAIWLFAAPAFTGVDDTGFENGATPEFFDVLRFPELDGIGRSVSLSRDGNLMAFGAAADSFAASDISGIRSGIGSVSLVSFGGPSAATLAGDLLFGDNPSDTTFIDPDDIAAILNAGNDLTLQFSNDLEIRSDIITNAMGGGSLDLQAGRNLTFIPGTNIDLGTGTLSATSNSDDALLAQRDPGASLLLLDGTSISAIFVSLASDVGVRPDDPSAIRITGGSTIDSVAGVNILGSGTGTVTTINGGSTIDSTNIFVAGRAAMGDGTAIDISGTGTTITGSQSIRFNPGGGVRIADGATLTATGDARIAAGVFQTSANATFDAFTIENASITTENGNISFTASLFGDVSGRQLASIKDSQIVAGGQGFVEILGRGEQPQEFTAIGSTISGADVIVFLNNGSFSAESSASLFSLSLGTQITTTDDGEIRLFVPLQTGVVIDDSSTLNGIAGNDLVDEFGNLKNSLGIGDEGPNVNLGLIRMFAYQGDSNENFSFYLASIDLTPGLFFTANDGQSTYGQTPIDPGISITRGVLLQGDTLETIGVGTDFDLTQFSDAGSYVINVEASDLNPAYRLLGTASGTFTILPADLLVTGGTYSKTYGETFVFPRNDFTVEGLVNNETIGPVQWLSLGTRPTADVMETPYAVGLSVSGQGSFNPLNYNISFTNGGLTVNPAPLAINPLAQSKVYGDAMLDQSKFNAVGLKNGETISSVSFASPGITATADVGDYNLRAAMVTGSGNGFNPGNYDVQFGSLADGLMVTPAALQIRPIDQFKLVGETFVFVGNEFTTNGLKNGDSVAMATLTSEGASENAPLGVSPILLSEPIGDFDPNNYAIQIVNGAFFVQEEAVAPDTVLSTGQLVYDQFIRYREFAETIDALIPANIGSIDTSGALSDEQSSGESQSSDDEQPNDDRQPGDDGEIYLPIAIRPR